MSFHVIVYLDQNYLSNMAKARVGSIEDEDLAKFWDLLFDGLKKAVLADKVACPEIEFHRHEAMYDRRVEEPIREVIDELSWGLQFCHSQNIIESQIEEAAKNFVGKQPKRREPWAIAFESNPRAPAKSRMTDILGIKGRINVHLSLSDEVIEHDRELKRQFADGAKLLVRDATGWDCSEVVRSEKMSFVVSFFGLQAEEKIRQQLRSASPMEEFIAVSRYAELKRLWQKLGEIGINISDHITAASFLMSDELLNVPYIDIYCSIHASMHKYCSTRRIRQSDFYDVPILAAVLPYCDIVTTDSFMKEVLVNKLHFDQKYKARIFSATKVDRLAFHKFVKELDVTALMER